MGDWLFENAIGLRPPLQPREHGDRCARRSRKIIEGECRSIEIADILADYDSYHIRGFIQNSRGFVPTDIDLRNKLILHSCFDELWLYIFALREERVRLFHTRLSGCQSWGAKVLELPELVPFSQPYFFAQGPESLSVVCKTRNLRAQGVYHYAAFARNEVPDYYTVSFAGRTCLAQAHQCILCFRVFHSIGALADHINSGHSYYSCDNSDGVLDISRRADAPVLGAAWPCSSAATSKPRAPDEQHIKKLKPAAAYSNDPWFPLRGSMLTRQSRHSCKPASPRPLAKNKTLIEHEYDTLPYSDMLADHLNSRLPPCAEDELELMREWNTHRVAGLEPKSCLKLLVSRHSATPLVIRMLDMLYVRGVLSSAELMEVLECSRLVELSRARAVPDG
ncbi:hypothetical protein PAPHI01_2087 [Pancytospora philotis]|nr:hypothetical protein PAPHI01_2087 [Pancytospora philotis]